MEGLEEYPHPNAAPSTVGSNKGGPLEFRRSSQRTLLHHWERLEREYFRPATMQDIITLHVQLKSVQQTLEEAEAPCLYRKRLESSCDETFPSRSMAYLVKRQLSNKASRRELLMSGVEDVLVTKSGYSRSDSTSRKRLPSYAHLSQGPPSDSSASTSHCSFSDKETKFKRMNLRGSEQEVGANVRNLSRQQESDSKSQTARLKPKDRRRAETLEEGDSAGMEDEDDEFETRSAFSRDDEDDQEEQEAGGEERSQEGEMDVFSEEGGGSTEGSGEEEDVDFVREISHLSQRNRELHKILEGEVLKLSRYARLECTAALATSCKVKVDGWNTGCAESAGSDGEHGICSALYGHGIHSQLQRRSHEHEEMTQQMRNVLRGGSMWHTDDATCELYRQLYR